MRSKLVWLALSLAAIVVVVAATASGQATRLITGKDIAKHTINSTHLVDHTVQAHDLSAALLASLKGKTGPQGPRGDTGSTGATGAQGQRGATGPIGAPGMPGPKGAAGATGATGPPGQKGDPGAGLQVKGVVATVAALDLIAAPAAGDGYLVSATAPPHLYVWDGGAWVDCGAVAGVAGPAGPQGPKGDPGGVGSHQIASSGNVALDPGYFDTGTATCPSGMFAVGGGVKAADPSKLGMIESYPSSDGLSWLGTAYEIGDPTLGSTSFTVFAVCVS